MRLSPSPNFRSNSAGVLHTILFNRALGPVKPKEVDSELFDVTYVSTFVGLNFSPFSRKVLLQLF